MSMNAKKVKENSTAAELEEKEETIRKPKKRFTITSQVGDAEYPSLSKMQSFAAIAEDEEDDEKDEHRSPSDMAAANAVNAVAAMDNKKTDTISTKQMKNMAEMFESLTKNMLDYQTQTNKRLDTLTKSIELLVQRESNK